MLIPLLISLFLALNIIIFGVVNSYPIYWTQEEMFWQGFYWSMDGLEQFTMHLGFNFQDFAKPFVPGFVDGPLRTREVSYFVEMAGFKFWQLWGEVLFRNYTLIILHVLNCVLVWFVVWRVTNQKRTAWITAILALNGGAALATLLFPFRNAKILVMTFFLLSWVIIAYSPKKIGQASLGRLIAFFATLLLGLYTDEISFFTSFLLYFLIAQRDGIKGLFHPRLLIGSAITAILFALLFRGFEALALSFPYPFDHNTQTNALQQILGYWSQHPWQSLKDLTDAFFRFFLRRNFGYWDFTPWGIAAFIAFAMLLIFAFLRRNDQNIRRIIWAIVALVLVKAVLLPHLCGVHNENFMPRGTIFPSLFFFSYYYVYAFGILFALLMGLGINALLKNNAVYILVLACTAIISISNALHLKQGPEDALRFHNLWAPYRQDIGRRVLKTQEYLSNKDYLPVYASFPTGESTIVKGRRGDTIPNMYCHYFPVRYVRQVKAGQLILPLDNVRSPLKWGPHQELSLAQVFYDVPKGELYDLRPLREKYGTQFLPQTITPPVRVKSLPITPENHEVVFFIKGSCDFLLQVNDKTISSQQNYGHAYQLVHFNIKDTGITQPAIFSLILIVKKDASIQLIGPFID